MKGYKRVFGIYSAWDYTREIENLNRMSKKGWQLAKGGVFSSKFIKNEDICYCYQIDYNRNIEEMGRYIETFREQGWEYINSTFNGWHYFRKVYDKSVPDEEYEIYNDSESLKEMQGKWQKFAGKLLIFICAAGILELAVTILNYKLPVAILSVMLIIEGIVIGRGVYVMRKPQRADGHKRSWNGMPCFISVLIAGIVLVGFFTFSRGSISAQMTSTDYSAIDKNIENSVVWLKTKINYPDFYGYEIEGQVDAPLTVSLLNEKDGSLVNQLRVDSSMASEKKGYSEKSYIFLTPGEYSIRVSDFSGGNIKLSASIN